MGYKQATRHDDTVHQYMLMHGDKSL